MTELLVFAAGIAAGVTVSFVAGRLPRHRHLWVLVGATAYESITGPRTIRQYRCECGGTATGATLRGDWTLEQLRGEAGRWRP